MRTHFRAGSGRARRPEGLREFISRPGHSGCGGGGREGRACGGGAAAPFSPWLRGWTRGGRRPFDDNWTGVPHLGNPPGWVQGVGAGAAGPGAAWWGLGRRRWRMGELGEVALDSYLRGVPVRVAIFALNGAHLAPGMWRTSQSPRGVSEGHQLEAMGSQSYGRVAWSPCGLPQGCAKLDKGL